jgi:Holliday junction resolvase
MTTQREGRISGKIMDALRAEGVFCFKIHGGPTMMAGLPDIIACVDGQFLGLETKVPEKRSNVSPIQKRVHQLLRGAGARVEVVCGVQEALSIVDDMRTSPSITNIPGMRRGPMIND